MKKILLKIYYIFWVSKEKANAKQKKIRDIEWDAVKPYIKSGKFLDVGCGAGYAMKKAREDFNCVCTGIDPDPMAHGVGRNESNFYIGEENIITGKAENLPFPDDNFDTVYSSHVLEHVEDPLKSMQEMKRVMKADGVLIIGMPTATMALINWFTQVLFTTHTKIINLLFSGVINTGKTHWWEVFIPASHSDLNKTIISDVRNYKIKKWTKIVGKEFVIYEMLKPALYPYPEYRQLFRLRKSISFSSSVIFICGKL